MSFLKEDSKTITLDPVKGDLSLKKNSKDTHKSKLDNSSVKVFHCERLNNEEEIKSVTRSDDSTMVENVKTNSTPFVNAVQCFQKECPENETFSNRENQREQTIINCPSQKASYQQLQLVPVKKNQDKVFHNDLMKVSATPASDTLNKISTNFFKNCSAAEIVTSRKITFFYQGIAQSQEFSERRMFVQSPQHGVSSSKVSDRKFDFRKMQECFRSLTE